MKALHRAAILVENRFENMTSGYAQPVAGISRRELLEEGGKVAAAAAVSSVLSPFVFTGKAAATKKTLILAVLCSPPDSIT